MGKKIVSMVLLLVCFMFQPVIAAPGDLDTSFGTGGLVTTDFGGDQDNGYSVAIQSDGKIIVAGGANISVYHDFALARYTIDGDLDTGFGTGGLVTTDFSGYPDTCRSVVIQSDGKIIVAGRANGYVLNGPDAVFALARYTVDGDLDTGFGTDGLVTTNFSGDKDAGYSVAIQSDGKIIVSGSTYTSTDFDFALARYTVDGDLDTGFGTGGLVTTDFNGDTDHGLSVAIQSDGKIIVAGCAYNGTYSDFALARYTVDGDLDTGFGTGGLVTTDFNGLIDWGWAVAIQPDDKIIVVGYAYTGQAACDFALARYTVDGDIDTGFGTGGLVTTEITLGQDQADSVAIQSDGKIIVFGGLGPVNSDFALARYTVDGDIDTGFGTGGLVTTDFNSGNDSGRAVTIQSDGKIIAAGYTKNGTDTDFALARYLITYTLTYTAGPNGSINGTTPQTVSSGESGTSVTAVPDTAYHFVNWSDSSTDNPRSDTNVTADISVTANFALDDSGDDDDSSDGGGGGGGCFILTLGN